MTCEGAAFRRQVIADAGIFAEPDGEIAGGPGWRATYPRDRRPGDRPGRRFR